MQMFSTSEMTSQLLTGVFDWRVPSEFNNNNNNDNNNKVQLKVKTLAQIANL